MSLVFGKMQRFRCDSCVPIIYIIFYYFYYHPLLPVDKIGQMIKRLVNGLDNTTSIRNRNNSYFVSDS